jgi:hypothetical protein
MSDEAAAWDVLRSAIAEVREALGDRVVAAYALGSLVHGGFAPDVSDIDGLVILDRVDDAAAAAIGAVVGRWRAERVSLFWGDWATFADPPEASRLPPIVRRDLLDHGVAVLGDPPPAGLARPTHDDLIRETAEFAAGWLARDGVPDPETLLAAGRRETTKMVLFPVRFLATIHAGLAGSNDEAVAWYTTNNGAHAPLASAALRWRTAEIDDPALLADLPALYAEALAALRTHPAVPGDVRARLPAAP